MKNINCKTSCACPPEAPRTGCYEHAGKGSGFTRLKLQGPKSLVQELKALDVAQQSYRDDIETKAVAKKGTSAGSATKLLGHQATHVPTQAKTYHLGTPRMSLQDV